MIKNRVFTFALVFGLAIMLSSCDADNTTTACNCSLTEAATEATQKYLSSQDVHTSGNLYRTVISDVEKPMLKLVMDHVNNHQDKAAEILGMNRATLRSKLARHGLL